MPTINEMFSGAVLAPGKQRGYLVQVQRGGVERELGPYTRTTAQEVQAEFLCKGWAAYIIDAMTGELI